MRGDCADPRLNQRGITGHPAATRAINIFDKSFKSMYDFCAQPFRLLGKRGGRFLQRFGNNARQFMKTRICRIVVIETRTFTQLGIFFLNGLE
ncbi:hypothetical protein DR88_5220 [Klebsiella pneumoniae]|nr:hypothetical protein DR88_5220 [Klebsiella pneumoniae]